MTGSLRQILCGFEWIMSQLSEMVVTCHPWVIHPYFGRLACGIRASRSCFWLLGLVYFFFNWVKVRYMCKTITLSPIQSFSNMIDFLFSFNIELSYVRQVSLIRFKYNFCVNEFDIKLISSFYLFSVGDELDTCFKRSYQTKA